MFTTENNGLVFWSSSFSSGSVVLKKQQQLQQQQQSNHHNSSFHPKINNNSRNSCMTAKLDSSVTPTKFSATTENSSAISSVVTSPTSSVRSKRMHQTKQGAGTAVMQQQDRGSASEASEPKGPSSTMAAAAATTMARNNGHRVASAATTNTSTESLDPLNSKLLLSPYIYESIITYSAYPFDLAQKLLQTGDDALHFCHQRFWMSRSSIFKVIIITAATEIKAVQRKLFLVWHKRVLMTSNSREEEPDVINWKAK